MAVPVYKRILDLFEAEGVNTLFGIPDPDVYKRQRRRNPIPPWRTLWPRLLRLRRPAAVSYTHLDVYKRQM